MVDKKRFGTGKFLLIHLFKNLLEKNLKLVLITKRFVILEE